VTAVAVVTVPVATLWSRPEAVRSFDSPALDARPDIPGWIAAMTPEQQVDTEAVTQLLLGERVLVEEVRPDGWARVVALDQPADRLDPRGYPGWARAAHLSPALLSPVAPAVTRPSGAELVTAARRHLGAVYIWGGLSSYGLDCSGLVHRVWRRFGVVVPRDAGDQATATAAVPGDERAGDLYFFARPGERIHHVGIVTEPGRMVHASSIAHRVVEESLSPERVATLVATHRVP
jgi:gamma-D-glutamyl-L-lysine dipeptidyl-peptidase